MRGYDTGGGVAATRDDTVLLQDANSLPVAEHTANWLSDESCISVELPEDLSDLFLRQEKQQTFSQFNIPQPTHSNSLRLEPDSGSLVREDEPCCVVLTQDAAHGKSLKVCDASPTDSVELSNRNENRSTLYINGMNQSTKQVVEDVQALTAVTGGSVRAIINDNSGSFYQEARSAVLGFLSPILGHYAEPEAIESTMDAILDEVREGRQVRIFAYSQGSIIASNALELLHDRLSEEEWKKVTENVEVITAGAGSNLFPAGIRAVGMVHEQDFVPHLTEHISGIRSATAYALSYFSGLKPTTLHQAPVLEVPGSDSEDPHRFSGYMEDLPTFLLAAHTRDGRVDGTSLAKAIGNAALNGDFADHVLHQIIGKMRDEQNADFFDALRHYAPNGKIGKFPVGYTKTDEWQRREAA